MIGLIGIKRNTPLEIRERLTLKPKRIETYTNKLLEIFKEVVILATCNRTEIYFNDFFKKEELLKEIFGIIRLESMFLLLEERIHADIYLRYAVDFIRKL